MAADPALSQPHLNLAPSPWIERFASLVPPGGDVLDLAAGGGRHSRLMRERGHPVVAVDRDVTALTPLAANDPGLTVIAADLEARDAVWPTGARQFAGIVVTNYLHRPLFAPIRTALAPGGVLIYETFAMGNERFGKPSNPDFLLRPGELLALAEGWLVIAYENLPIALPRPALVQRIVARRG
jgi:SAM-dependent methyltransferase